MDLHFRVFIFTSTCFLFENSKLAVDQYSYLDKTVLWNSHVLFENNANISEFPELKDTDDVCNIYFHTNIHCSIHFYLFIIIIMTYKYQRLVICMLY